MVDSNLQINNGVARLTLSRPAKRNALSRRLISELESAVVTVNNDESARLLILAAEGPVFCAGMDLEEMQDRASQPDAETLWREDARAYRDLLWNLFTLPMPVVAVVHGPALAGGVGLVAAADVVLASETAWFSLPEPKRGITAAVVAPLLIHRIGPGAAGRALVSMKQIEAAEALRIGFFHEVAPPDELEDRVQTTAAEILEAAPEALAVTKRMLLRCTGDALWAHLDVGMFESAAARTTEAAREGLAAFLERRKPAWSE